MSNLAGKITTVERIFPVYFADLIVASACYSCAQSEYSGSQLYATGANCHSFHLFKRSVNGVLFVIIGQQLFVC